MVYLDNAATTPVCDAAKKVILENLDNFYNPNSSYEAAHQVKMKVEEARERIAELIGAEPSEVYFTSGASESNSWVKKGNIVLGSTIEHHSMRSNFTYDVDENGVANLDDLNSKAQKLANWESLDAVTSIYVNNEIGVIQPVKDIAAIAHKHNLLYHIDATQALPHMRINVKDLNCDMLSGSGHKFGAIKGCGFLYVKNGVPMQQLIYGGQQERGMRGSTTNVLGILAMAAALEDTIKHMDERNAKIAYLSKKLKNNLLGTKGVYSNINYDETPHVESILNFRIDGVNSRDLVTICDRYNICISSGSACNEGQAMPSHVLKSVGLTDTQALSSIRISLSHLNTEEEIDYVNNILPKIITRLRQ